MPEACSSSSKEGKCHACSAHTSMLTLLGLLALVLAGGLVAAYFAA